MDALVLKINEIINQVGTTWKIKRALLRNLGLDENSVKELVPEPPKGMGWHPGDL